MEKKYLFKGGSLDNKRREVEQGSMYFVPFLKDNGRFYAEKYRRFKDEFIYAGTTLRECDVVADNLGSWRKVEGQEFSERELNLQKAYEIANSNFSLKGVE